MSKKGYSVGFTWLIALILLTLLGVGYVVLNQVMVNHIEPVADGIINRSPYLNETEKSEVQSENNKYMAFWNSVPFILVLLVVIWLIVTGMRRSTDDRY